MQLIRRHAHARAGLIGNPSDGYGGKTISLSVHAFRAEVVIYEWEDVEIVWSQEDQSRFRSIGDLVRDVRSNGYYGGIRLVKATVKRFADYCHDRGIALHDRNFSLRYQSNIPRQVGLAGSSAIVVATLRCLMDFFDVSIPEHVQPSLALSVETDELRLPAGLQDRVIQVYEGLVYMDFARDSITQVNGLTCARYERLDPRTLPPLYLAYGTRGGKAIQEVHNDLRARFDRGDPKVLAAMKHFAELTVRARAALAAGDVPTLNGLIDENFNTRQRITAIREDYLRMVQTARAVGASANFSGSGGAIVGIYRDEAMFAALERELSAIGCRVLRIRQDAVPPTT